MDVVAVGIRLRSRFQAGNGTLRLSALQLQFPQLIVRIGIVRVLPQCVLQQIERFVFLLELDEGKSQVILA